MICVRTPDNVHSLCGLWASVVRRIARLTVEALSLHSSAASHDADRDAIPG